MQRTTAEKIEKFISEYQTKIDRCYDEIKDLKKELASSRKLYRGSVDYDEIDRLLIDIERDKSAIKVQEKKKDILVQAKSDFEDCL